MRKRDRDWMIKQIVQLFDFCVTQSKRDLYADGRCIPGAISNQMADMLVALIDEQSQKIRDAILALPETERRLAEWDRLRRGEDT